MVANRRRVGRSWRLLILTLVVAWAAVVVPPPSRAALPAWTGGINLWRPGSFTTQKTWLWCTAANVQIIRNIVHRESDHSYASQERYFWWMRAHNRYRIPVSDGVDPRGWASGFRRWVDGRYRTVVHDGLNRALRSAARSMRLTRRPVGLLVAHGGHAWVLHGFTATADPAVTGRFTVTSVRVTGPLWGLQSRNGYDMPPNTRLTADQLRRFWTPWHYAGIRMVWEGRIVAIQAMPDR